MGERLNQLWKSIARMRGARHWDDVTGRKMPPRVRWWDSQLIVQHVNENICGEPLKTLGAATPVLIKRRFPGRTFPKAVSIGCGTGFKEMMLIEARLVEEFDLFELSKARLEEGTKLANSRGLSERVKFHNRNGLAHAEPERFDLVHWSNSLHHMIDVDEAVAWSRKVLKPNGVFFMDDFVGPDRMQWPDRMLKAASRVRAALPERFLQNPYRANKALPRRVKRPHRLKMLLTDPTECADSSRIIPAVMKWFPNAEIRPTGGAIYHLALNDVLHNMDEVADRDTIQKLLRIDDLCTARGDFHYAIALAEKTNPDVP